MSYDQTSKQTNKTEITTLYIEDIFYSYKIFQTCYLFLLLGVSEKILIFRVIFSFIFEDDIVLIYISLLPASRVWLKK